MNRKDVRDRLLCIKNNPKLLNAVRALLNGEAPSVALLLLDGEMVISKMERPPKFEHLTTEGGMNPYWRPILEQMEKTNWDIDKLNV